MHWMSFISYVMVVTKSYVLHKNKNSDYDHLHRNESTHNKHNWQTILWDFFFISVNSYLGCFKDAANKDLPFEVKKKTNIVADCTQECSRTELLTVCKEWFVFSCYKPKYHYIFNNSRYKLRLYSEKEDLNKISSWVLIWSKLVRFNVERIIYSWH